MNDIHHCDKGLIIEEHSAQLRELKGRVDDTTGRIGAMETELHGHPQNGGGFIAASLGTMEIVRAGQATQAAQIINLTHVVERLADKPEPRRSRPEMVAAWAKVLVPVLSLISVIAVLFITASLTRSASDAAVLAKAAVQAATTAAAAAAAALKVIP